MTEPTMHLLDRLRKRALQIGSDLLREGLRRLIPSAIETQVAQCTGARPSARTPERNGYRERPCATRRTACCLTWPRSRSTGRASTP